MTEGWFSRGLLSAVFAALTAIFARIGIEGVDSDLATLVRTVVIIVVVLAVFVRFTGKWSDPFALPVKAPRISPRARRGRHRCRSGGGRLARFPARCRREPVEPQGHRVLRRSVRGGGPARHRAVGESDDSTHASAAPSSARSVQRSCPSARD